MWSFTKAVYTWTRPPFPRKVCLVHIMCRRIWYQWLRQKKKAYNKHLSQFWWAEYKSQEYNLLNHTQCQQITTPIPMKIRKQNRGKPPKKMIHGSHGIFILYYLCHKMTVYWELQSSLTACSFWSCSEYHTYFQYWKHFIEF